MHAESTNIVDLRVHNCFGGLLTIRKALRLRIRLQGRPLNRYRKRNCAPQDHYPAHPIVITISVVIEWSHANDGKA